MVSTVRLDASDYTVIGVMPKGFTYPLIGARDVDAWVPLTLAGDSTFTNQRGSHYLTGVGRLKPGVSLAEAGAELHAISVRLAEQYPGTNRDRLAGVKDLQESIVTGSRTRSFVLAGAVAACCSSRARTWRT